MKKAFFVFVCYLGLVCSSFSQSYNRMENPNYAKTIFFEDFNSVPLNTFIWNVSAHTIRDGSEHNAPNLSIWVDSVATVKVNQTTGSLELSMLSYANYSTTDYSNPPNTITANFID